MNRHLPECREYSLAEMYPDEEKPDDMPDASWCEIKIAACAPGCPAMAENLKRGRELAEKYGWV